ncbi:MAG: zincin-like metallopeptidase domain-containing protein [Acidobacteria bacterium]|nr:zincin-like metallopeptidase domain-containing protein [Acidobacteriota bacterium]
MAGGRERAEAYHQQFAERIIQALKEGAAPWQKPWKPGERMMPHNFGSGRDYRGGNAVYLAMQGLDRGYADPRWGGYRQIQEAGGHVRKGEKGTPIMYVEWRQKHTARDDNGNPVLDENGRNKLEWVPRDRPLVKLHHVFNVEQTEGLQLRSLAKTAPEWEGHEHAEALIRNSGVRVDHVAGDRAYYSLKDDRVVLPDRSQFESQSAYTHTALHELGHATGHPARLNRATLVKHGGFGSEAYAREELRAEIAAMMTGEQLGVGHEPRHGTAYVSSWIKALENDPREIRAAAVDAQRISDWLIARERERKKDAERTEHEPSRGEAGRTRQPIEPDRSEATLVGERSRGQTVHGGPEQEVATPAARVPDPAVRGHSYDSGPTR